MDRDGRRKNTHVYQSPNQSLEDFSRQLYELGSNIRKVSKTCVIGGDFNVEIGERTNRRKNEREDIFQDWTTALSIINEANSPTFYRGESGSTIDATLASARMANKIKNWKVRDDIENLSDHYYIMYIIEDRKVKKQDNQRGRLKGWKIKDTLMGDFDKNLAYGKHK
ncbi:hypothetical protein ILUMI_26743 [Ignelater luminosus]|uniref:Endonuclease/exonuclease/phosphatase domain-containing protein n=1 Tax=Ignelater luminosus TaxID=2038154 RepID=A0A8K0C691_IGNLU|nr:hypothetical protein ILUMI_26743 [Ignelater luminosus]